MKGPTVVCLCGSTRFMEAFFAAGWQLTLLGQIVLSVGVCKHADADGAHGAEALGPRVAANLDKLHLRKIDMADWVLVLNVQGYFGTSTMREIDYATNSHKPVYFLFPDRERGDAPMTPISINWDGVMAATREAADLHNRQGKAKQ